VHIDEYSFGKMTINKQVFTSDVIVYPDRVDASWWRREGHYLQKEDLSGIIAESPEVLIIGTGDMGVMQVPEATIRFLEKKGIEVHIEKTGQAVKLFNNQPANKKVIGAFHLTC
jgi:hypothetical protein